MGSEPVSDIGKLHLKAVFLARPSLSNDVKEFCIFQSFSVLKLLVYFKVLVQIVSGLFWVLKRPFFFFEEGHYVG